MRMCHELTIIIDPMLNFNSGGRGNSHIRQRGRSCGLGGDSCGLGGGSCGLEILPRDTGMPHQWCRRRAGSQTGWEEGVDSPSVISATQTAGNSHVPHPQLPPHEDKEDPEFPTGLSEGRQRMKSSQLLVNFQFPANFRGMAQADLEYPGAY